MPRRPLSGDSSWLPVSLPLPLVKSCGRVTLAVSHPPLYDSPTHSHSLTVSRPPQSPPAAARPPHHPHGPILLGLSAFPPHPPATDRHFCVDLSLSACPLHPPATARCLGVDPIVAERGAANLVVFGGEGMAGGLDLGPGT